MRLPTTSMCQFVEDLSFFASCEWELPNHLDKSIYKSKDEYIEVFVRHFIHLLAVEHGLMQ